ncbi:MAG: tetratricopeptide repeat protein [Candidatus Marinimicrobia bacterium]|nr:tetratricopeptide repeat protein [Candidatus Neomarinimicrobiota bacterium]
MMTQKQGISGFIEELRRRRVFRVAAVYGGVAFVLFQIIDSIFEPLHIPEWIGSLIIILLLVGFPLAMGLAWVFDITPEGIVRTKGKTRTKETKPLTGNGALIAVAIAAVAFGIWGRWAGGSNGASHGPVTYAKSVAVLPFSNLSNDPNQEFFSDGFTDNILINLYKFSNLKVIGRTSVMQYKGTTKRLSEIGEELGVETLVEGSVQRVGDRIVIAVQLIDAETEVHLWAEQYDRRIDDIFDIQNEVAKAIAEALNVTLTPGAATHEAATRQPTENLAAWDAYLQGKSAINAGSSQENIERAIAEYERATRLDPTFAEAWAELAIVHLLARWGAIDRSAERLAKAEWALNHARKLAPDTPAVINAIGRYYYHGHNDYARALQEFHRALAIAPTNSDVIANIGFIERRLGNVDRAVIHLLRAFELEPKSGLLAAEISGTYFALDRLDEAAAYVEKVIALSPGNSSGYGSLGLIEYLQTGDINAYQRAVSRAEGMIPEVDLLGLKSGVAQIEKQYDESLALIRRRLRLLPTGDKRRQYAVQTVGMIHWLAGRPDSAKPYFDLVYPFVREEARQELQTQRRSILMNLAGVEAFLGMGDSARFHADQAVNEYPITIDAYEAPGLQVGQAFVYCVLEEYDRAIAILDTAFTVGGTLLKYALVGPGWHGLKRLPEFADLAEKHNLPGIAR